MQDDEVDAWMFEMKQDAEMQAFIERLRPTFERLGSLFETETSFLESFMEEESTLVQRATDIHDLLRAAFKHLERRWVDPTVKHAVATALCNMYLDPAIPRFIEAAFRGVQKRQLRMADHPVAEWALDLKKYAAEVNPARREAIEFLWSRVGARPPDPVALFRAHSLLMSRDATGASQRRMREMLDVYGELVETRYRRWLTLVLGTLRPLYDAPDADPFLSRLTLGALLGQARDALRDAGVGDEDVNVIADRRCVVWRNAVAHRNLTFDPLDDVVTLWNEAEGRRHSEERVTSAEIEERLTDLLVVVGLGGGLDGALGGHLSHMMDDGILDHIMHEVRVDLETARPAMEAYLANGNLQVLELADRAPTLDADELAASASRRAARG